ncbi:MAG: response regulator [Desulfuromonadaceae bacterium]
MLTDNPAAPLILVVEDDDSHVLLIQRSLEETQAEYRLERFNTVAAAVKAIEKHAPDLILTDYRLPDGEGIELVPLVNGACPVVIMTSHGNEQLAVEAMKIGVQDYIVKSPGAFEELPHTVLLVLKSWAMIVARRLADKAVIRAKKDWERTFDAVPDLITTIDINHTITRVNRAMADRCGLTADEIVGRKCYDVVHESDAVRCCCPAIDMMQDGRVHTVNIKENTLNGFFEVTVSPLFNDQGRVTAYVHIMRDITERMQMEEKLLESEEKYRHLAHEQQIILNASSVGIIFVKNRKVLWANPAHCRIFGYEPEAVIGMDTAEYYADKESYEFVGEHGYAMISTGGIFSEDFMMKKKDGSLIWCNLVGQAINPENTEEGSIWSMLDISLRKRVEEERQQLEHQFHHAQKLESLGVLAGGIAHDFNNILTIILGHCYMAGEDLIPEQDFKATFKQIESAGNRAADLCRQMLTYAGKSPLVQTHVNLWLLVDEVVKMLQAAFRKNVTIELDVKRVVPEIIGDTSQIQQIVMNLIINAAEAIGEANGTIRVALTRVLITGDTVEADAFGTVIGAGGYICLEVTDSGSGMDEETQKRIFEPFFTTKFAGRGLGMSAIHGIVTAHGALLQMTSKPDAGTTFKVFFPVPTTPDTAETTSATAVTSEKEVGTVLLVDDEQALRNMGTDLLEAMGFTILTAENGHKAVAIYRECGCEIGVVLLDLAMPEMGGIETYHELRKINPLLPVIICSGYNLESVEAVIRDDPHACFVQKPYNPVELRCALTGMME